MLAHCLLQELQHQTLVRMLLLALPRCLHQTSWVCCLLLGLMLKPQNYH
jgi:hypothetical protein